MIARAGGGTDNSRGETEALCLSDDSPMSGKYTTAAMCCDSFAKNTAGPIDGPPDYGATAQSAYDNQCNATYENGQPMFAPDGTMLDSNGNRSIFDDIDDLNE